MTKTVPAAARTLEILGQFKAPGTALTAPEIAERLELPKSTCHELVRTLVAHRFLKPSLTDPHRFELDIVLFELGNAYVGGADLWDEAWATVRAVAAETEETTQIGVLDGTDSLYLAKVDSPRPVRLVSEVGKRVPAHCTAGGKMMLSDLSTAQVADLYRDRPPYAMTSHSISSLPDLLAELEQIREQGFATDRCESNSAVCCVAAAVRDQSGDAIAALSVSVPTDRAGEAWPENLRPTVVEAAAELSTRLGWRRSDDSRDD